VCISRLFPIGKATLAMLVRHGTRRCCALCRQKLLLTAVMAAVEGSGELLDAAIAGVGGAGDGAATPVAAAALATPPAAAAPAAVAPAAAGAIDSAVAGAAALGATQVPVAVLRGGPLPLTDAVVRWRWLGPAAAAAPGPAAAAGVEAVALRDLVPAGGPLYARLEGEVE
jgi:hypothetical protein